ncbi:MAG: response regulator [Planctomycetes bacterium]|nr:response regulator [Planctomycetota bacterium]
MSAPIRRRALVIDDTRAIHEDYRKILAPTHQVPEGLDELAAGIFGDAPARRTACAWELEFATQGAEGVAACRAALEAQAPFLIAFVDMRMPPGWDGLRTIQELWRVDSRLEVVLCTAFSDRTHDEITQALGDTDRLIILKKPFDTVEVVQLVRSLGTKWDLEREREARIGALAGEVEARNRELAERVEELGRANERLQQAILATACASRARDEFLTNVTHELRTPLTSILGYAELICETAPPGEVAQHSQTIRSNGQHLLALINDLLDLSRIEAGAMPVEEILCSPRQIVHEVAELLAHRARQKGLRLVQEIAPDVPQRVVSDPTRLRQILVNLAGNAIKFTAHGVVEVHVACTTDAGLELSVRDTGIGLSADQRARLFVPFSQADASTARKYGGTGLGLSITRRLVELLGGTIVVESELGAGSTFRVRLPLRAADLEPAPVLPAGQERPAEGVPSLGGARVLVIDDARDVQRLVRAFLERAGAVVEGAADGVVGLERALQRRAELDLVLLDMMMPELDGYEVARRLRAAGFEVPIVALTAHAHAGDEAKCLEAGCDAFVQKPIDRRVLLATCERLAREGRPAPDARAPSGR